MTTKKPRPAWSVIGGGALLAGALALLVATGLEYFVLTDSGRPLALFWSFLALFIVNLGLYGVAMAVLAFGAHGSDGIVGTSVAGKAGLVGFALFWLLAQSLYLSGYSMEGSAETLGGVLMALTYLSAIVAAVVIARRAIAPGSARWSLLAALAVSLVVSVVVMTTDSPEVLTIGYLVSAAGQALVGLSYLRASRGSAE